MQEFIPIQYTFGFVIAPAPPPPPLTSGAAEGMCYVFQLTHRQLTI